MLFRLDRKGVRTTLALSVGGTLGPAGKKINGIPNTVEIPAVIKS